MTLISSLWISAMLFMNESVPMASAILGLTSLVLSVTAFIYYDLKWRPIWREANKTTVISIEDDTKNSGENSKAA